MSLLSTSFSPVVLDSPVLTSAWNIAEFMPKLFLGIIFEPWGIREFTGDIDVETDSGNELDAAIVTEGTTVEGTIDKTSDD